jgi:hypothetical protein
MKRIVFFIVGAVLLVAALICVVGSLVVQGMEETDISKTATYTAATPKTIWMDKGELEIWYKGAKDPGDITTTDAANTTIVHRGPGKITATRNLSSGAYSSVGNVNIATPGNYSIISSVQCTFYFVKPSGAIIGGIAQISVCCAGMLFACLGLTCLFIGMLLVIKRSEASDLFTGKGKVWGSIHTQLGPSFSQASPPSSGMAYIQYKNWTLTIESIIRWKGRSAYPWTRISTIVNDAGPFTFSIYRKTVFTILTDAVFESEAISGYPDFDAHFTTRSNDQQAVSKMLSNQKLRDLLMSGPDVLVSNHFRGLFSDNLPDGSERIMVMARGTIKDVAVLKNMFETEAALLDALYP